MFFFCLFSLFSFMCAVGGEKGKGGASTRTSRKPELLARRLLTGGGWKGYICKIHPHFFGSGIANTRLQQKTKTNRPIDMATTYRHTLVLTPTMEAKITVFAGSPQAAHHSSPSPGLPLAHYRRHRPADQLSQEGGRKNGTGLIPTKRPRDRQRGAKHLVELRPITTRPTHT